MTTISPRLRHDRRRVGAIECCGTRVLGSGGSPPRRAGRQASRPCILLATVGCYLTLSKPKCCRARRTLSERSPTAGCTKSPSSVNPAAPVTETTLREVEAAAGAMGLGIRIRARSVRLSRNLCTSGPTHKSGGMRFSERIGWDFSLTCSARAMRPRRCRTPEPQRQSGRNPSSALTLGDVSISPIPRNGTSRNAAPMRRRRTHFMDSDRPDAATTALS
jgi:hypothetical protein